MFKSLFQRFQSDSRFENIDAKTLKTRIDDTEQLMIVDVRSADEYATGRIAGARLLPLPTIAKRHKELPKNTPLIITCRSGARSRAACEQLSQLGFTNLHNLQGGVMAWRRAGLPLVS